jgi:ABC-type multidrug transport system fused ATPase/permease subunit
MILASFAEIVSIGMVFPFLAVITNPTQIFNHPATESIVRIFSLTSPEQLALPLTVIFIVVTLFAGFIRLLLLLVNTRLSFSTGSDVSVSIYRKTLYQPYIVHISRNSSEIINGIAVKVNAVVHIMMQSLNFFSSIIIIITITFALVYFDPIIAFTTIGCFALIYLAISVMTNKRLLSNGRIVARESNRVVMCLQEGLGGIRDIIIAGNQEAYSQAYLAADLPSRRAQGNTSFISSSPKHVVEAFGMVLIALVAYALTLRSNPSHLTAIPTLGLLAIAAQRLLPNLQQAYGSWASMQGQLASFEDVLELLSQPIIENVTILHTSKLNFVDQIQLNKISFRYNANTPLIIDDLNLTIKAGSCVGFVGVTGCGKSTLMDIIMGLLAPSSGTVLVDGVEVTSINVRDWHKNIAHVPQDIFLIDSSVAENIAFGKKIEEIDYERVKFVAQQAKIAETIEAWSQGYNTVVGERGVRLSGGQRQRLGIARALYCDPTIIIFDEATSALDNETEADIMHSIEKLNDNLTILIVAHRTTTLKNCDKIIQLGSTGSIIRSGTYDQIFESFE